MAKHLLITEVLEGVSERKGKVNRIEWLRQNKSPALCDVLRINFDDDVVSLLPKGIPPYRKDDAPIGYEYTNLSKSFKRFKYFFKGRYSNMEQAKREKMFIDLLESIHGDEAEMLCLAKDGKLYSEYKGLTKKLVQEAFPGLIRK